MKFKQSTKSAIWQEARKKVGGFGMWLEVQLRVRFDTGEYYTNRLIRTDDDSDLSDFIHWNDFTKYDFEMINGYTLLDIPVHDKDELLDNLLVLLNDKGELIRSFTITEACSPESYRRSEEFLSKYAEPQQAAPRPSYTLKVTETKNKSGRYHYQVVDELGNVLTERRSNRLYVACTINGQYYFGRMDLIGKGDHGSAIRWTQDPRAKMVCDGKYVPMSDEERQRRLAALRSIAYLEQAPASLVPILAKFDSWQEKRGGQL